MSDSSDRARWRDRFPLHLAELEMERLCAHLDRNAARRVHEKPAPPTRFGDFAESRTDHIGLVQRAAKAAPYSPEMFDRELVRLLAKEAQIEANKRASQIMRGNHG